VRETTLQTPRTAKKEGEEVLQGLEQRFFSPAAREDHGEAGCPPAAHGGPTVEQISTCSPWKTPCRNRFEEKKVFFRFGLISHYSTPI